MKKILRKSTETIAGMVVGGVAVLTISSAFSFTLPFTFSNGTPANADQVNANFNALKDRTASPTLVSNGTVEIGPLLGFSGSNYSGMSRQGYMFQINNSGALMPTADQVTVTTSLQSRWTALIASYQQLLTNNRNVGSYPDNYLKAYNNGTLYYDSSCTNATAPTIAITNNYENLPGTYSSAPSIPPRHIYKIANDPKTYVFTGSEPTFNGVSQTFSFTPYFKATTGPAAGFSHCCTITSTPFCSFEFGSNANISLPSPWIGTVPTSSSLSTMFGNMPYFQTYPTNLNTQATTGIPDIGFAPPISIEMR